MDSGLRQHEAEDAAEVNVQYSTRISEPLGCRESGHYSILHALVNHLVAESQVSIVRQFTTWVEVFAIVREASVHS